MKLERHPFKRDDFACIVGELEVLYWYIGILQTSILDQFPEKADEIEQYLKKVIETQKRKPDDRSNFSAGRQTGLSALLEQLE